MKSKITDLLAQTVQYAIAITELNEILKFIELGLAIICSLIIIIPKIKAKIKKALEDGKITKEEFEEITDEVKNGIEEIKDLTNKE